MRRAYAAALVWMSWTSIAHAEIYQAADLSQVSQEEDLRDLLAQGDLDDEDVDLLIELLLDPIDINRAGRDALYQLPSLTYDNVDAILAWRAEHGRFSGLGQLLEVEGITADHLAQLAPFAIALPPLMDRVKLGGSVKGRTAYTWDDERTQEGYVRVRAEASQGIEAGLVLMEQPGLGDWAYDPNNMSFDVTLGDPVFTAEKAYVQLTRDRWSAIVGNYTVGFGQRLVFDNSQRNRPNGFYKDDRVNNSVDFSAPQRNFGVAATWEGGRLGGKVLGGTAFVSVRRKDLYETYFSVLPPDGVEYGPLAYGLSVDSYLPDGTEVQYLTYPNLYNEALAGLHGDLRIAGRHRLGLTAYGARVRPNAPVYFTNQIPDRPFFGAVGLDGQTGFKKWDAAGEVAVTDQGGVGAVVRAARGVKKGEVVVIGRHYGVDFDNPYSRGQAQPDVYSEARPDNRSLGDPPFDPDAITSYDRDRDEQGVRLEGTWKANSWLRLTGYSDQWRAPSTGLWDLDVQGRADLSFKKVADWDVLLRYQDRVLSQYGRARSFGDDTSCDPDDPETYDQCGGDTDVEVNEAAGAKITAATYLTLRTIPASTVYLAYRRFYEDDRRSYIEADCLSEIYYFRIGQVASLKTTTDLPLGMRATTRLRYSDEDVYGSKGQRNLAGYGQLEWVSGTGKLRLAGRYTFDADLRDPMDKDYIRCENGGVLPDDRSTWPADEPLRPITQSVLATVEVRF